MVRLGRTHRRVQTPFTFKFSIEPVLFTGDHVVIIAAVPPIIIALAWFMLRTDVGIAVRAAADNADRALLYGIPIRRLSTIVWTVAGGLAGLTFILKAPFAGSTSTALGGIHTLLLPALAAAVVAKMESLPTAFAAGVGLEILSQVVFWNTRQGIRDRRRVPVRDPRRAALPDGAGLARAGRRQHVVDGRRRSVRHRASCKNLPEVRVHEARSGSR